MKNMKLVVLNLLLLAIFTGCTFLNNENSEKLQEELTDLQIEQNKNNTLVKESFQNLEEANSLHYKISPVIQMEDAEFKSNVELEIEGDIDKTDPENIKNHCMLKLKVSSIDQLSDGEEMEVDIHTEIIQIGPKTYVKIDKLGLGVEADDDTDMLTESLSEFTDKWYYINTDEIDSTYTETTGKDMESSFDEEAMKDYIEILSEIDFMIVEEDAGTETIAGIETKHLKIKLDEAKFIKFVQKMDKISHKDEMTEEDVRNLEKTMESTEFNGEIWLGVTDNYIYRFVSNVIIEDEKEHAEGKITITVEFSDYNQELEIERPTKAEDLNKIIENFVDSIMAPLKGLEEELAELQNLEELESLKDMEFDFSELEDLDIDLSGLEDLSALKDALN